MKKTSKHPCKETHPLELFTCKNTRIQRKTVKNSEKIIKNLLYEFRIVV